MELTVTITSLKVPERAAMILANDPPSVEFGFDNSRITVVRNSNTSIVGAKWFNFVQSFPGTNSFQHPMYAGATVTFNFPYDATAAPYNVYAEIETSGQGGSTIYKADCTLVPGNSGWYWLYTSAYYNNFANIASCPNPPFTGSYLGFIAVDTTNPQHFVRDIGAGGGWTYFWRSPALFTIN